MTVENHLPRASVLDGWRKSSHSGGDQGNCVEVLDGHPALLPVRDSKNPHGPALLIPKNSWASFVTALKEHRV